MAYPIENLFRPPVELLSAVTATVAGTALLTAPHWFMTPPPVAWTGMLGFYTLAAWRLHQGYRIVRFHRNLKRLPKYVIAAADVPVSDTFLFLGRGFAWDQRHSQRLLQSRDPANRKYVAHGRGEWGGVGGDPTLHGVEPDEDIVVMDLAERNGHTLVLGTTRVGKTRLAEVLICQDIRRGDIVIVFDPKGDADLLRRMYAEARRAGREKDFYFFHLGYPDISARYNPVGSFSRITEVATRTAGPLPSEGQSAAFRQFVWLFVNVIARALNGLGHKPSYALIYQHATNIDALAQEYIEHWLDTSQPAWQDAFDEYASDEDRRKAKAKEAQKTQHALDLLLLIEFINAQGWFDPVANALAGLVAKERGYFEKLVASLYPFLEKLTTGKIAELISPDYEATHDSRPIFDWMSIINRGGIVYVGLDSLSDFEVGAAIGNAMFADLTSIAGQLYKFGAGFGQSATEEKRRIVVHADEFNELIGDEFIPLLNKAGGAGFQVTVYTQTWSDVEAKIGNRAKAGQIGGNLNTLIMLRVKNSETAEILTNQLPEVSVASTMLASAASDTNDPRDFEEFGSRSEDRISTQRVPMLTPADLVKLPKGQAFALIEGGRLYKVRLPLFDPRADAADLAMPASLEVIAADMKARYDGAAEADTLTVPGGWL